jgi:hypothetical protein
MSLRSRVYGFIPTSITGCTLWLDGADPAGNGVVPANNATVSTWADKSGNGLTVSAASSQPTYSTNVVNNLGTVAFNGSQSLSAGSVIGEKLLGNSGNCAIFVVMRLNNSPGRSMPFSWDDGTYTARLLVQYDENSILYVDKGSFPYRTQATISLSTSLYYIISYSQNGANTSLNVNGTSVATLTNFANNSITSSTRVFNVGSYVNGSDWNMRGNTAEIIFFNTHIPSNFQQVEGYLAQKWGLRSSLPLGHPGLGETIYRADYTKQNVMTARPYFTAFSPRQIPGCALWLDAADSSTITGTSPVTQWRDKSVNNYSMTYTGSPTYRKTAALNLGCITFNGTTSFNSGTDTMYWSTFSLSQPFTVFTVCTKRLSSNSSYSFVLEPSISSGSVILYSVLQLVIYAGSANQYTDPIISFVANSTQIYSAVFNGPSSILAFAGSATSSLNPGSASWPGLYLGRDWGGTYDSGDYGEIIFYSGALSTTQRQQVESYLAQKWGLTASLPGGHLNATQPAGALTLTALTNFRILSRLRTAQFLPTSIAGLQMWMDAADSSTNSMTLSGSTVTVWKDKSGLGNNTTARSGTSTLTSNAINGKSAISMAGGYFTGPFATANTGNQLHAFGVMTIDSSSGVWPRPLSLGRPGVDDYSSSTTTFAIIRYAGTQAVAIGRNGQYLNVGFPAYSTPFLVQSSHNGATEFMGVNGTLTPSSLNTGQTGNFNITSYALGVNTNTGDYFVWNGLYAEVLYFNVQLSEANRQRIEGYLAWKWGLQALLPGGHPHASAAP